MWIGRLFRLQGSARAYPGYPEPVVADCCQSDQEGGSAGNGEDQMTVRLCLQIIVRLNGGYFSLY
jgi:hypothetical protein